MILLLILLISSFALRKSSTNTLTNQGSVNIIGELSSSALSTPSVHLPITLSNCSAEGKGTIQHLQGDRLAYCDGKDWRSILLGSPLSCGPSGCVGSLNDQCTVDSECGNLRCTRGRCVSPLTALVSGMATLELHLDARYGVKSDGEGNVLKWEDQSGRNRHAFPSSHALAPKAHDSAITFQNGAALDVEGYPLPQPVTIFVVAHRDALGSTGQELHLLDAGPLRIFAEGATNNVRWTAGSPINHPQQGRPSTMAFEFNGALSQAWVDGVGAGAQDAGLDGFQSVLSIGARRHGAGQGYDGRIFSVIIFAGTLTDEERVSVFRFLDAAHLFPTVPNLFLRLEADYGVQTSGSEVAIWEDLSANGRDFSPPENQTAAPSVATDIAYNQRQYVRIPSGASMDLTFAQALPQPYTVFWVARTSPGGQLQWLFNDVDGGVWVYYDDSSYAIKWSADGTSSNPVPHFAREEVHVGCVTFDGVNSYMWLDGASRGPMDEGVRSMERLQLGYTSAPDQWVDLWAFIVFSGSMGESDRRMIEQYLTFKYVAPAIPGLAMLLDARVGVSRQGSNATSWEDASGHGRNVDAQACKEKFPQVIDAAGPNYRPGISFPTGSCMTTNGFLDEPVAPPLTVFWAGRVRETKNGYQWRWIYDGDPRTGVGGRIWAYASSPNVAAPFDRINWSADGGTSNPISTNLFLKAHTGTITYNGASSKVWVNGEQAGGTYSEHDGRSLIGITIGSMGSSIGVLGVGTMGGWLSMWGVYQGALSDAQIEQLSSYLGRQFVVPSTGAVQLRLEATAGVETSGSRATFWEDQSIHQRSVQGYQDMPLLVSSAGLLNRPTLRMTSGGLGEYMGNWWGTPINQPYSIWLAATIPQAAEAYWMVTGPPEVLGGTLADEVWIYQLSSEFRFSADGGTSNAQIITLDNMPYSCRVLFDGANGQVTLNGVDQGGPFDEGLRPHVGITIGARFDESGQTIGDISGVWITSPPLDTVKEEAFQRHIDELFLDPSFPDDVPGLEGRWEASGAGLTLDSGGRVLEWRDLGPKKRHLIGYGRKPQAFENKGPRNRPGVLFLKGDAVGEFVTGRWASDPIQQPYTLVYALGCNSAGVESWFIDGPAQEIGGLASEEVWMYINAQNDLVWSADGMSNTPIPADTFLLGHVGVLEYNGASSRAWFDGAQYIQGNQTRFDEGTRPMSGITLGRRSVSAGRQTDGYIHSVLVYEGVLDDEDRVVLEEYLMKKYF